MIDNLFYNVNMNNKKNVVLFDLDGTLAEAREEISFDVCKAIANLALSNTEIGIVTGSGLDYIQEQVPYINDNDFGHMIKHIMPCNGTQYYMFDGKGYRLNHSASMRESLGNRRYRLIVEYLLELQCDMLNHHHYSNSIPLSGEFISYRGPMINWSPIGRAATKEDREEFIKLDSLYKIRNEYLNKLKKFLKEYTDPQSDNHMGSTVVLGGQTSFDIYPIGWDKCYTLAHFKNYNIYFVGDKCTGDGNDRAIYDATQPNSFEVKSPQETINLINNVLISKFVS